MACDEPIDILEARQRVLGVPSVVGVHEHLAGIHRTPVELVFGMPRKIPPLAFSEDAALDVLSRHVADHVTKRGAGRARRAPVNVVLDVSAGLVVQPSLIVLTNSGQTLDEHVWGVPAIIAEVAAPKTPRYRRAIAVKLHWYRHYGVQELWLIDVRNSRVELIRLPTKTRRGSSHILPGLPLNANLFTPAALSTIPAGDGPAAA